MIKLMSTLALAACAFILAPAGTLPARAMCGGNIFMTCPPQAQTKKRERKVREPRRRRGARSGAASR